MARDAKSVVKNRSKKIGHHIFMGKFSNSLALIFFEINYLYDLNSFRSFEIDTKGA